jgi:hypothetical protein
MKLLVEEAIGILVQSAVFLVGLAASVAIGMLMAMHVDSTGGLVVVTILAGAGLLAAASFSQTVRDRIVERQLTRSLEAAAKKT